MTEGPIAIQKAREPVRQLSVFLDNRVGALKSLAKMLEDHHIAILGLSLHELTELTLVRLVLSDPDSAGTIFIERGIPHTESDVVIIELAQGAADLTRCLTVLLAAEVNIRVSYPLLCRPNNGPLLALHVDDAEACSSALQGAGIKVLGQAELSR
jgi:hypothetical protein